MLQEAGSNVEITKTTLGFHSVPGDI